MKVYEVNFRDIFTEKIMYQGLQKTGLLSLKNTGILGNRAKTCKISHELLA